MPVTTLVESDEEKTCASRAEASVKPVILFHTKLSGYQEEGASITSLSFPRSTNPHHYLHPPAAIPHPCNNTTPTPHTPQCMLVPCYLKQQQSATKTTCYSSGFLASHPKISPQSCQLTMLLPRKISASTATIRVWPVFPTAIWSQRLSPTRHESLSCNSVKMRSLHPPCSRLLCGFFQEL